MVRTTTNESKKEKSQKLRRIRMHISHTKWLSASAIVENDSIILLDKNGTTESLTSNLISKTQRSIYQVRKSSNLAGELIKSPDQWIESKLDKLETYKILNNIPIAKLKKSYSLKAPKKQKDCLPILAMLEIEAHCINRPEPSIIDYILKNAEIFNRPLQTYLSEYNHTEKSKALAALILGAIHKKSDSANSTISKRALSKKWLKDCYSWSKNNTFPNLPIATIEFIHSGASTKQIKQLNKKQDPKYQYPVNPITIRRLNRDNFEPSQIIDLFNACIRLHSSIKMLLKKEASKEDKFSKKGRQKRAQIEAKHKSALKPFYETLDKWLYEIASSEEPYLIANVIDAVIQLGANNATNLVELNYALNLGLSLDRKLRTKWLNLVAQKADIFWVSNTNKENNVTTITKRKEPRATLVVASELLTRYQDEELIGYMVELFITQEISSRDIKDIEIVRLIVTWLKKLEANRSYSLWHFMDIVKHFKTKENAKQNLEELVDTISQVESQHREHVQFVIFEALDDAKISTSLEPLVRALPDLIQATIEDNSRTCPCYTVFGSAVNINNSKCQQKFELINTLQEFYAQNFGLQYSKLQLLKFSTMFCTLFLEQLEGKKIDKTYLGCKKIELDSLKLYRNLLTSLVIYYEFEFTDFAKHGLKELKQRPEFSALLIDKLKTHPKQVWDIIENLGIISRLGKTSKSRLDKLKRFNEIEINQRSTKTMVSKGWKEIIDRTPTLKPLVLSYIFSKSITQQDQSPPNSLLKVLDLKGKLLKEKEYLESFSKEEDKSKSIDIRIANLEKRIANQKEIDYTIEQQLRRHLFHISKQAELDVLEYVIKDAYRYQFKTITGHPAEQIKFDSYMRNALLLTQDIEENRRLLKRLIKNVAAQEPDFRFGIVKNQKFLQDLESKWKIDKDVWLSTKPSTVKTENILGGKVHFKLENDPLKVLEMGNYFDTCLSFGGINSYSTVINACDLNKRVLYAYNTSGIVIGRKLIGISDKGLLVGFRTYTSVDTKEGRTELRNLIHEYIKEFAKECRLELSNRGDVEPLSSEHWYDDGVVKWSTTPEKVNLKSKEERSVHN